MGDATRGGRYLLAGLIEGPVAVLLLPLAGQRKTARHWAVRHQRRALRMLRRADEARPPARSRVLAWMPAQALVGTALGVATLLVAGNALVAVLATGFWWAFSPADPPRLFVEVPVRTWSDALLLGPLQFGLLTAVAALTFGPVARLWARACLVVLAPSPTDELIDRVNVLTRTRADVLDAHASELRRIERDLHDGTQAHLVAIAVRLGVAEKAHARGDHEKVGMLVGQAHSEIRNAMESLRAVLRSVYPPILSDRGLPGALAALTATSAVPARLELGDVGRLPAAVESVVYFVVAEALTNVARHSGATAAEVSVGLTDRLFVCVTDDGTGAADPSGGSGLQGIRERARALDGTLRIDSPAGGPTRIRVELPCAW
ncbi:sensor histidine kinase [Kineosporia succinea]|uniref:histidine kinase n=1 Tax=Kineosporia succinea TaxID=84632 RepID=A0ABT9P6T5_9ACTN|nr:histidine kinase [Kineosporia succinea]MDP9828402.1 signal transduction histidine kinase [Kineosporia succinea]